MPWQIENSSFSSPVISGSGSISIPVRSLPLRTQRLAQSVSDGRFRPSLTLRASDSPAQLQFGQRTLCTAPVDPQQENRADDGHEVQQHHRAQRGGVAQPHEEFSPMRVRQLLLLRGRIFLDLTPRLLVYPIRIAAVEAESQKYLKSQKE